MKREDLVEFATRDRLAPARLKAVHWAERKRALGAQEGIRTSQEIRRYIRTVRPTWPTEEDRDSDLQTHTRVGEMLRSVGPLRSV